MSHNYNIKWKAARYFWVHDNTELTLNSDNSIDEWEYTLDNQDEDGMVTIFKIDSVTLNICIKAGLIKVREK